MTASVEGRSPEQLTRNWNELLQELRVMQTGVQILTAFLLTVPFSSRFEDLEPHQRTLYLVVLCGSVLTTILIVAPVSFHRTLFRQRQREWIVEAGHLCARAGLHLFALVVAGVVLLVVDVVAGTAAAWPVAAATLLAFVVVWAVVPRVADRGRGTDAP